MWKESEIMVSQPKRPKLGHLRALGKELPSLVDLSCFPEGERSCEEPKNSCRSKVPLAQCTSQVQNLLYPHILKDKTEGRLWKN